MTAPHTLKHAQAYLRDAQAVAVAARAASAQPDGFRERKAGSAPMSDYAALMSLDPGRPCAAFWEAKRALLRTGTIAGARVYLTTALAPTMLDYLTGENHGQAESH